MSFSGQVAVGWLVPLLLAVYAALRPYAETAEVRAYFSWPRSLSLHYFSEAWQRGGLPKYYLNTVIITVPAVLLTLFLASCVAFVIARFELEAQRCCSGSSPQPTSCPSRRCSSHCSGCSPRCRCRSS